MSETTFAQYRPYIFAIAYRMLGSVMDAEDMVQETFLRWRQVDQQTVKSPKSYLATIITRLCLDFLQSARVRRESYIGPWLPEPLLTATGPDAERLTELTDSLEVAFLVLLESLTPAERAAFLLREIFAFEYKELAQILEKSEANCRQIVRRARQHIRDRKPRFQPEPGDQTALLSQFVQACTEGDVAQLTSLLAEDVVHYSDGGGQVSAARKPVYGPDKVARFLLGLVRQAPPEVTLRFSELNGQPALLIFVAERPYSTMTFDISQGQIHNIYAMVNPDKLRHLPHN